MSGVLSDNDDVMNALMRALCDPGFVTPRAPLESLQSWQRRAIVEHAAPLIAAAERERSEALIAQAQDYARAESARADKLAALALKILNQCCALEPADDAAYLDDFEMALEQLEGEAGEMSPPDSDPLEDAYQTGIKAERQRLALAVRYTCACQSCKDAIADLPGGES